jgi:hypothetical protein
MSVNAPSQNASSRLLASAAARLHRRLPPPIRARISRAINPGGRRFLGPGLASVESLMDHLERKGIKFVAIDAPEGEGDRRAILIDDESTSSVDKMLTQWPVGSPVEIYAVTGPSGFAFGDIPFLPPRLARRLLDENRSSVDQARELLLARLYIEIFLKGWQSVLVAPDLKSKIVQRLNAEARSAAIDLPPDLSLAGLADLLNSHGWVPPVETLERIAVWNPFAMEWMQAQGLVTAPRDPGLVVFYVRERAVRLGLADEIEGILSRQGFSIIPMPRLDRDMLRVIADEVRGGNWGKGPFPQSGGEPERVIVAFDPSPIPPSPSMLKTFPLLDNERIQIGKQVVRDAVKNAASKSERFNAMHSTDNAAQAWRALNAHFPNEADRVMRETSKIAQKG